MYIALPIALFCYMYIALFCSQNQPLLSDMYTHTHAHPQTRPHKHAHLRMYGIKLHMHIPIHILSMYTYMYSFIPKCMHQFINF